MFFDKINLTGLNKLRYKPIIGCYCNLQLTNSRIPTNLPVFPFAGEFQNGRHHG